MQGFCVHVLNPGTPFVDTPWTGRILGPLNLEFTIHPIGGLRRGGESGMSPLLQRLCASCGSPTSTSREEIPFLQYYRGSAERA